MEKELFEYHVVEAQKIYKKYEGENGGRFIDLTGKTFHNLTVLYRYYQNKNNKICWVCVCSCGKYTIATGGNLTSGGRKHCGDSIHRIRVDLTGKK